MRLTLALFDADRLRAFSESLVLHQPVLVRVPWGGGRTLEAPACITKIGMASVIVDLVRMDHTYPLGVAITVPRWNPTTWSRWSPNNGVFPREGVQTLLTPAGRRVWRTTV